MKKIGSALMWRKIKSLTYVLNSKISNLYLKVIKKKKKKNSDSAQQQTQELFQRLEWK